MSSATVFIERDMNSGIFERIWIEQFLNRRVVMLHLWSVVTMHQLHHCSKEKHMTTSTPAATIPLRKGLSWHTLSIEWLYEYRVSIKRLGLARKARPRKMKPIKTLEPRQTEEEEEQEDMKTHHHPRCLK